MPPSPAWQVQVAVYGLFGLGFYLLHSCIQVQVTDLSQTARGAAASLHSAITPKKNSKHASKNYAGTNRRHSRNGKNKSRKPN